MIRGIFDGRAAPLTDDEVVVLYRWLSIPRYATILISTVAIGAFWLLRTTSFDPRPVLFGLVPAFIAVSAVSEVLIRRNWHPLLLLNLQLLADLVGVTVGVQMTGGAMSPFALLYVLVVISASLISVRALVIFGVSAGVLYEAVAFANTAPLAAASGAEAMHGQDPLTIIIFALIVALIAFQSSYYMARIREKDEEVIKLKDEFLFRTIHDLRSPTTAIRFTLEKYEKDPAFAAIPGVQKDFQMVDSALARISLLIEDLLKVASGNNPVFRFKQDGIDIRNLIRGCALELEPQMSAKKVTFVYSPKDGMPPVIGDSEKLKEVFCNFFDNAIKYNREGGSLTVSHRLEKGMLLTDIADTGIGISHKSQSKLFAPFFRGDIGSEIAGTGLGLFMTRKLLQKMRGSVTVSSTEGRGTTFTVSLPTVAAK